MTPLEIAAEVSGRLTAQGLRHLIGGSFASSAWGELRATNDVDIATLIKDEQADLLAAASGGPYHISMESIKRALAEPGPYRLTHAIHAEESFSIDLFLVRPDPYTLAEFERVRWIELGGGRRVSFSAPEDIVLQKLRWFEDGNRVSDRQWNDIVGVLDNQRESLDYGYPRRWADMLGLDGLLTQALADRTSDDPFA